MQNTTGDYCIAFDQLNCNFTVILLIALLVSLEYLFGSVPWPKCFVSRQPYRSEIGFLLVSTPIHVDK